MPAAAAPLAGPGGKKYGLVITEKAAEPVALAPEKVLKLEEATAMIELRKRKKAAAEAAAKSASPWDEMVETAAKAAVPAEPKWPNAPWKSTRFAAKKDSWSNRDVRLKNLEWEKCKNCWAYGHTTADCPTLPDELTSASADQVCRQCWTKGPHGRDLPGPSARATTRGDGTKRLAQNAHGPRNGGRFG
jgi:hypothetical protein